MATYTVTGHPLNPTQVGLDGNEAELLRAVLATKGVGQTFTLTLTAGNDTKAKGHKLVE